MKCNNPHVPKYLHKNSKRSFRDKDFLYFQKVYRLKKAGNQIEIPEGSINAISCRWSKLINKEHIAIPLEDPNSTFTDYMFVYVQELKTYKKIGIFEQQGHGLAGQHQLTCEMFHRPEICNYSHVEILIRHRIYRIGEKAPYFDKVYSYEDWQSCTAELRKSGGKFFKEFRKQFRLDMIKLFSRNSSSNRIWNDVLAACKCIGLNSIDVNFQLQSA